MSQSYDLTGLHAKMLDILSAIDATCRRHNLRYYIIAGTLLGAVRHKGFIPWDDDADVCMPHSDYDKLLKHWREWLPEGYELICGEQDSWYPQPFAKIQDARTTIIEHAHLRYLGGVYVDVFPLDGMPSTRLGRRWHYFKYRLYCKLLYFTCRDPYRHGHGPSSWLPLLCRKLFTASGLQRRIRRLQTRYDFYSTDKVLCFDDRLRAVVPREIFGTPIEYDFEGRRLLGPAHPHQLLSQMYGDYMTPPPPGTEFRHNFHYLDLDTPYREYKG